MKIEYVTHASLLLDNGETRILLDPFYFMDDFMGSFMCHFPPRDLQPRALGSLDYIFSSHIHPDHCHEHTLAELRSQVKHVLLPAERPALVDLYTGLGYPQPTLLEREATTTLSDRARVTVYWDGSVDTVAVVEMDGCTILHQNDCRLSQQTLRTIASRHQIDVAFLLYTSAQNLFPFILDRPMAELEQLAEERERGLLEYQVACVEILRPKTVVPYSMTMTFTGQEAEFVNTLWRLTPSTFCDGLRARRSGLDCVVMHPGDSIEWSPRQQRLLKSPRARNDWGTSLEEFRRNVSEYLTDNRDSLRTFKYAAREPVMDRLIEHLTARLHREPPEAVCGETVLLSVRGAESSERLALDFAARRVSSDADARAGALFTIDVPASLVESLLDGAVDPFVALYTYRVRFTLHAKRELQPELEGMLYLDTMLFLFATRPTRDIAETNGLRLARKAHRT